MTVKNTGNVNLSQVQVMISLLLLAVLFLGVLKRLILRLQLLQEKLHWLIQRLVVLQIYLWAQIR